MDPTVMMLEGVPTEGATSMIFSFMGGFGIFGVALLVLMVLATCKVYTKAGRLWWEGIIPVYNTFIFLKIIDKSYWNILLFFVPIVNIIFMIMFLNRLSKKFGYGTGFTVGLLFLPIIFWPILAWGKSTYNATA